MLNKIWPNLVWIFNRPKNPIRVILLGLGKTGTSITAYRIHSGMAQPKRIYFETSVFGTGAGEDPDVHRQLCAPGWNVVTKCLVQPQKEPNWHLINSCAEHYNRRIWITRDPRDRLLSDFFYGTYWRHAPRGREEEFETYFLRKLQWVREKEQNPRSRPFKDLYYNPQALEEELRQLYDNLTQAATPTLESWYVLHYEDFVDGRVAELNDYLGIEVDLEAEVAPEFRRLARTRGHSNWREWFTPEDVDFFRPLFSDYLTRSGYDADDWELTPNPSLDPEVGSKYLEKLFYDHSI